MKIAYGDKNFINSIPKLPGIYKMLDIKSNVLYVGKSKNLRKRVASYFQKAKHTPRILKMINQICYVETTVTRTEAEALILENTLIKSLKPRYNILYRDDKTYPYIYLTDHKFPRILYFRSSGKKNGKLFGPYTNPSYVKKTISEIQKSFLIRSCADSVFNNRTRPCLLFQLKRCSAPCVSEISEENYKEDIKSVELFLKGRKKEITNSLITRMQEASYNQEYEIAAEIRDKIESLKNIQEVQFIEQSQVMSADIISVTTIEEITCVNLVVIRDGTHMGDKSFFPINSEKLGEKELIEYFLSQQYLDNSVPSLIILNVKINFKIYEEVLSTQADSKVHITNSLRGKRKILMNMSLKNAEFAILQKLNSGKIQDARIDDLKNLLNMKELNRIECFDISHTMGKQTVASCVVYENKSMQKSQYRIFDINEIIPGDDCAAIKQVVFRRYHRLKNEKKKLPDLILIDGGKAQAVAAKEVTRKLGIDYIHLIGVSKGQQRKSGDEKIVFPSSKSSISFNGIPPSLLLIQTIRDEAHRFAVTRHVMKRGKNMFQSRLNSIPGVGPKIKKRLILKFGSVKSIMNASEHDLSTVDGVNTKLANLIKFSLN